MIPDMDGLDRSAGGLSAARPQSAGLPLTPESPSVVAAAKRLHDRAAGLDKRVTSDIVVAVDRLADTVPGVQLHLDDLGLRVKTTESLARKVADDAVIGAMSPEVAAAGIHDALRYTVVIDEAHFTDGVRAVLDALTAQGHKVNQDKVWNFFIKGNRYKGVHAVIEISESPTTRSHTFPVEVQFHTAQSLEIKRATHHLYDIYRDARRPLATRRKAYDALTHATDIVEHPPKVSGLGKLKPSQRPDV